jgi:EAL domain-containing protein (putative c-di-GMP-specific phosphodiesterase class I)/GGDEF domain-containing protein
VTSERLPPAVSVQNRLFPKTRSWFALGSPLELLSPLSVLRVIYALAVVLWAVEAAALDWPAAKIGWAIAASVSAACAWGWLRAVKDVGPLGSVLLAFLGSALALVMVATGTTLGPDLAATSFLLPMVVFVALYLGTIPLVVHQIVVAVAFFCATVGTLHAGSAAIVTVAVSTTLLLTSVSVRVLVNAAWRGGTVDPDTGLPNGTGLAQSHARLDGSEEGAALATPFIVATVLLGGVDEARQALGYRVGSELLRRSVEHLGQILPPGSLIARVEADELVVTQKIVGTEGPWSLDGIPPSVRDEARNTAEALVATIDSGRFSANGLEISLRAHVGIALAPWDGSDIAELVRRSSLSARRAYAEGQTVAEWDGDREAMTAEDLTLLADLRVAVERNEELWLGYQPQISTKNGDVPSVEALLRWDSPIHGAVSPGRFIPLAERTGFVDRLTEWVLQRALDAQVRWRDAGIEVCVAVNLSARNLKRPELATWILSELDARGLPPSALSVELTETVAADLLQAVQHLRPLHDRGVHVAIDDFGTGYTSLKSLPFLPLDEIKVDMQFVRRAATSPADEAIVRCVQDLAHRLGLRTVAEGVEDEGSRQLMTEVGFDLLQGHLFAKALAEEDLLDFLNTHLVGRADAPPPIALGDRRDRL